MVQTIEHKTHFQGLTRTHACPQTRKFHVVTQIWHPQTQTADEKSKVS